MNNINRGSLPEYLVRNKVILDNSMYKSDTVPRSVPNNFCPLEWRDISYCVQINELNDMVISVEDLLFRISILDPDHFSKAKLLDEFHKAANNYLIGCPIPLPIRPLEDSPDYLAGLENVANQLNQLFYPAIGVFRNPIIKVTANVNIGE